MPSLSKASFWVAAVVAVQVLSPSVDAATTTTTQDPCAAFAAAQKAAVGDRVLPRPNDIEYMGAVDPEIAYNCATSIPIDNKEAAIMVDNMKNYTGLLSTLTYLKNPPKSYQQPSVDVMARLDDIGKKASSGKYNNKYEFDLDVYNLQASIHEGHFGYGLPTIGLFSWFIPNQIVSVSSDGQSLPQVYAYTDILNKVSNASPIVELGGDNVFKYLRNFIETKMSNAQLEAHGDFNQLMPAAARDFSSTGGGGASSYSYSLFSSSTWYNGKSLQGKFANGTSFEWKYLAGSYLDFTAKKFTSGKAIYAGLVSNAATTTSNKQGVNQEEENYKEQLAKKGDNSIPKVTYDSYPTPDLRQWNFGNGGLGSAYFLKDDSIAVLSLPSFGNEEKLGVTSDTYSILYEDFISQAKKLGSKKIVIDVQGNGGGVLGNGYNLFYRLFPNKVPNDEYFRGRHLPAADTWGRVVSGTLWNNKTLPPAIVNIIAGNNSNTWALDLTFSVQSDGKPWTSWDDYWKGEGFDGDTFTQPMTPNLDLTDPRLPNGMGLDLTGDFAIPYKDPPFAAEDIIFLTDGFCASTCHTLSMFLKNNAGVKSVVVGGLPEYGPMQAVSGTRGGAVTDWNVYSTLTYNIKLFMKSFAANQVSTIMKTLGITSDDVAALPPLVGDMPWKVGKNMRINTMNIVRPESPKVTRQFVYEAADCRVFYTADMYNDITQLWRIAAKFAGGDKSVCVKGSTEGPGTGLNNSLTDSPGFSYNDTWNNVNTTTIPKLNTGSSDGKNSSGNGKDDDSAASTYGTSMAMLMTTMFAVFWM